MRRNGQSSVAIPPSFCRGGTSALVDMGEQAHEGADEATSRGERCGGRRLGEALKRACKSLSGSTNGVEVRAMLRMIGRADPSVGNRELKQGQVLHVSNRKEEYKKR
eukprot:scaffold79282_cov29-Tisochrysis_lutea.AAC.7